MTVNPYLKFIVGALSAILTSLAVFYGREQWYPVAVSAVGAVLVYLVPNVPAAAEAPPRPPA